MDQIYFNSIFHTLQSVKRPGKFATGGICDMPQPSLSVVGMTDAVLGLPLCEAQANSLLSICTQAPYGKGTETIVDTSVRCTWQLNPDQFTINNSNWKKNLAILLPKVIEELGCTIQSDIHCELYKLLLYQPGGFFKVGYTWLIEPSIHHQSFIMIHNM